MNIVYHTIIINTLLCVWLATSQCQFNIANYNVSFDLSPLALSSDSYQIAHSALIEYTFYINFCANAHTSSSLCNNQNDAYAFVEYDTLLNSNDWCESASGATPQASLIIDSDPSFGIILEYSGGSTQNGCTGNPRSMNIYLMCDTNVTDIQSTDIAWKYDDCKYKIEQLHTPYACPLACHSNVNGELCNNHGECGYDWSLGRAKCFCFHQWSGSLCDTFVSLATITPPMYV